MEEVAKNLSPAEWPFPIVQLFLDKRSLDATLEAAGREPARQWDTQFYIGEYYLLRGDREESIKRLQMALERCPKDNFQYRLALEDLLSLRQ